MRDDGARDGARACWPASSTSSTSRPSGLTTARCLDLLDRSQLGAVRHRRSALRIAVGPRFPPGIPAAVAAARALSARAAHRAHRHRRSADARRDHRAPRPRRRARVRLQLRPAEHPLHHRRQETMRAAQLLRFIARRASGRGRHRLLPVATQGRRDRGVAGRRRRARAALPRRHGRRARAAITRRASSAKTAS